MKHRAGVQIYRLVAEDTIEDRMLLMQDQKASVAAKSCDQSLSKAQLRSNTLDGLILDFFDDDKVCLCLF